MSKETPDIATRPRHMRLAVSGASGFLGSVIAREACELGCETMVWTRAPEEGAHRLRASRTEKWPDSPGPLAEHIVSFSPHCIVHCAGSASVAASIKDPYTDLQASFGTCALLLEAIRISGKRPLVIFLSSAAVYGNPVQLPVTEGAPLQPISPYGSHKVLCENLADEYRTHFGIETLVLRLFSVFGPSQKRLLIHELFEKCTGPAGDLVLAGTGAETRDFLSEWCVAGAVLALAENFLQSGGPASCKVLNLASGVERSISEVAGRMRELVSPGRPIKCLGQERPGDPTRWHADVAALQRHLPSWRPLAFEEALKRTIALWQPQPSVSAPTS